MHELSRSALHAACRAIYDLAGDGHVLPSLIRAATAPGRPSREFCVSLDGAVLSMAVRLAEPAPGRAPGQFDRTPLEIAIEARCEPGGAPLVVDGGQRFELIRAFLLAAREPIVVDQRAENAPYRVAIRLSPDFAMPVEDAADLGGGLSADDICRTLADRLYARSDHLFACRESGVAVWTTRLEQELFGEAPPSAWSLWPAAESDVLAQAALAPDDRRARRRHRFSRQAAAAVAIMFGFGAVAAALGGLGGATPAGGGQTSAAASAGRATHIAASGPDRPGDHSLDRLSVRVEPVVLRDPMTADMPLASIAPATAASSRALSPEPLAASAPRPITKARTASRAERSVHHVRKTSATANPIAKLGRAVVKLTRSIRAIRLPRLKITAMNNPYAAGPR